MYNAGNNIERFKKGFQLSKNLTIFSICLFLAVVFWGLKLFSNTYTTIIEYPIKYINFPTNKVATNYIPNTLAVKVEAQGYDLLLFEVFNKNDSIILDGKYLERKNYGNKNYYYLSTKSLLRKATQNNVSDILIKEILTDTIPFRLDDKITKTVLVDLKLDLSFAKQYELKNNIKLRPEAVQISGPKSLLDTIQKIPTEPLVFKKVNNDISTIAKINPIDDRINIKQKKVLLNIEVEKYTEAEISIPIHVSNVKEDYTVKIFPSEVKLTYLVGLSDYESILPEQFNAEANLNTVNPNENKIKVTITSQPKTVKIIKQEPKGVEFIIRK